MPAGDRVDEFDWIARLLRPLTGGEPAALSLLDDVAVLPCRPGFDLVLTKDAMVAGVHFLADDPLDLVARKLLRTNLSDLAAKGAEPFGYLLMTGWPPGTGWAAREAFARGLAEDGERFGLSLLGGDTVSTPGPASFSATLLGWVPSGRAILRSGARPGDRLAVSGTIGDGWLGLLAARGEVADPDGTLAAAYRLPEPRLDLRQTLRSGARAAADISDGLLADAGHIARASGCAVRLNLDQLPLSRASHDWMSGQPDLVGAHLALATGGDDYQIVCALPPDGPVPAGLTVLGVFEAGEGVSVRFAGKAVETARLGWTHD